MALYARAPNSWPMNEIKASNKNVTAKIRAWNLNKMFRVNNELVNSETGESFTIIDVKKVPVQGKGGKKSTSGAFANDFTLTLRYNGLRALYKPIQPNSVTIKRNASAGRLNFTVSWKLDKTNTKSSRMADSQTVQLNMDYGNGEVKASAANVRMNVTSYTFNLADSYTYPAGKGKALYAFKAYVRENNGKGSSSWAVAQYIMTPPPQPSLEVPRFDANTGIVSCVMKTTTPAGNNERYDTVIGTTVTTTLGTVRGHNANVVTRANQYTVAYDFAYRQALGYGDYARILFTAYNRGSRGNSGQSVREYYIAYPLEPKINSYSSATRDTDGKITFAISVPSNKEHPITGVRAQKLISVEYEKAEDIPGDANWVDFGPTDNGNVTAIAAQIADILPAAGMKTWVRLIVWYESRDVFFRYSSPIRLQSLEIPLPVATAGPAEIYDVSKVGEKVRVRMGWDDDDGNFTQVAWSVDRDSWISNKQPEMFAMRDDVWDEGSVVVGESSYQHHTTIYLSDLDMAQTYFIRARRLIQNSGDDPTNYSAWSDYASTLGQGTPFAGLVTLNPPAYIIYGEQARVSWSLEGELEQSRVVILALRESDPSYTDMKTLATVNGKATVADIPWKRIIDVLGTVTSGTKIKMMANVYAETYSMPSETCIVPVLTEPNLSIGVKETLTRQPIVIGIATSDTSVSTTCVLRAGKMTEARPDGMREQVEGDVVWSDVLKPDWKSISSYEPVDVDEARAAYESAVSEYESAASTRSTAWESAMSAMDAVADAWNAYVVLDDDDPSKEVALAAYEAAQATYVQRYQAYVAVDVSEEEEAMREAELDLSKAEAMAALTLDGMSHVATVELPTGLWLIDGNEYTVELSGMLEEYGLSAETQRKTIEVNWSHKAPEVPDYVWEVEPHDEEDSDGNRLVYAKIPIPVPPTSYSDDVCDVYRVSKDRTELIYEEANQGEEIRDMYAPFGMRETYIVETRTADGSRDWFELPYVLRTYDVTDEMAMRIDWPNGYVEIERGLTLSDSYAKDFELRKHLDGSMAGYWNKGIERTSSYSGCIIRGYDEELDRKLRELARYDGPCFIRTSDSGAFEADIQLDGIDESNKTARVDVSMSITEVDLTAEYMASAVVKEGQND